MNVSLLQYAPADLSRVLDGLSLLSTHPHSAHVNQKEQHFRTFVVRMPIVTLAKGRPLSLIRPQMLSMHG